MMATRGKPLVTSMVGEIVNPTEAHPWPEGFGTTVDADRKIAEVVGAWVDEQPTLTVETMVTGTQSVVMLLIRDFQGQTFQTPAVWVKVERSRR
jgi:hypothetical protein